VTLAEAQKQNLECTFLSTAHEAEVHAATLAKCGREVVAIILGEFIHRATEPSFIVVVKPAKRVVGPFGFETRRTNEQLP
jgi:hypothetical protein